MELSFALSPRLHAAVGAPPTQSDLLLGTLCKFRHFVFGGLTGVFTLGEEVAHDVRFFFFIRDFVFNLLSRK